MTCIAFDGKTIAVDKQGTAGGTKLLTRKWRRLPNGILLLWEGSVAAALATAQWFENGAEPDAWPECQRGDNNATLIVLQNGRLREYAFEPHGLDVETHIYAWGSGGNIALGAMEHGATAREAVETASRWNAYCGMGVDVFDLNGQQVTA